MKLFYLLLTSTFSLLFPFVSNAQVALDNFINPLGARVDVNTGSTTARYSMLDNTVIGGERDVEIFKTSTSGNASIVVEELAPAFNYLSLNSGSQVNATFVLTYDGADGNPNLLSFNPGLGGLNMMGLGNFQTVLYLGDDVPAGRSVTLTFKVFSDEMHWSQGVATFSGQIQGDTSINVSIPRTSFTTGLNAVGPASFSNVKIVQLTLSSTIAGFDATLDEGIYVPSSETPLPVFLKEFNGTRLADKNVLNWSTVMDSNNDFFAIERSYDSKKWNQIGVVYNSNDKSLNQKEKKYNFIDSIPIVGKCFYRLKQVDINGISEYSNTIMINVNPSLNLRIYPNPVKNSLKVFGLNSDADCFIYEIGGKLICETKYIYHFNNEILVDMLNEGIYFIKFVLPSGQAFTQKIIKEN